MQVLLFVALLLAFNHKTMARPGSAVGTLNQVHPDPVQKDFEQEYDKLQQTIKDLPKESKKTPSPIPSKLRQIKNRN